MCTHVELPEMDRVAIDGVELEVHERGSGEPVVFIHAIRDDWYGVLAEPALAERYRLIYYHRRGHGGSDATGLPLDVSQQAADCRAVMDHFDVDRAHFAGLSGGGGYVLQFAIDFPDAVHSLALFEPTVPVLLSADPEMERQLERIRSHFEAGEMAAGFDAFLEGIAGPGYEERFDRTLPPGWFDRQLGDWGAFQHDIAALQGWEFDEADAARIAAPVLNVTASDSLPRHQKYHETIQSWIPHAEPAELAATPHTIPQWRPEATAELVADFFSRHPMEG